MPKDSTSSVVDGLVVDAVGGRLGRGDADVAGQRNAHRRTRIAPAIGGADRPRLATGLLRRLLFRFQAIEDLLVERIGRNETSCLSSDVLIRILQDQLHAIFVLLAGLDAEIEEAEQPIGDLRRNGLASP